MSTRRTPHPPSELFIRYRATKATTPRNRRARDNSSTSRLDRRRPDNPPTRTSPPSNSPIILLRVGPEGRLFAAHEAILSASRFFAAQVQNNATPVPHSPHSPSRRIDLPDEQPEVLSCVLEFLYKGDYHPRLRHDPDDGGWRLEDTDGQQNCGATVFHHLAGTVILRDTAVYCAATKYALPTLQRLALRKQGLHSGIQCSTILSSARYAYAHTPDTESRLRAHYLALIIRCRSTFKASGTMQMEMERGGKMFFDLFVAICNHMDDLLPGAASVHSSAATTH